MQHKDKLDLSRPSFLDFIVDYRRFLVAVITVATIILAWNIPRLETDPGLDSGMDKTSAQYQEYMRFVSNFGNEEFILIAVKTKEGAGDPKTLDALAAATRDLAAIDKVVEVMSLSNFRVIQERNGLLGNYPVWEQRSQGPVMSSTETLTKLKNALPLLDMLVSRDLKTLGILVRVDEQYRMDVDAIREILKSANTTMNSTMGPGADVRMIGPALIRQAIVRYNIQTGIIFGILCMLIGTAVSVYVFKSARVTAITNIILAICVIWVLGFMSVLGIPLNSTTALSFGFIPITTVEIVIHMVVRYHQYHQNTLSKIPALKQTVRWLARPCLICSSTTAVGFGTLMVSSIPMVRQLGFIMSTGIVISFCLAMVLTPAFFFRLKALDARESSGLMRDWLDSILLRIEEMIFQWYRWFIVAGIAITAILFAAAPQIRTDTQILRMLSESTSEVQNIAFVEDNLSSVHYLELMLQAREDAFKDPMIWKKVQELENRLRSIPAVVTTDSFLSVLRYLDGLVSDNSSKESKDLFSVPDLIPQLLVVTSFSPDGERMMRRYINEGFDCGHIAVRIRNTPDVPIGSTIAAVRAAAQEVMEGTAKATVTGEITVIADQTENLITDQIRSMFLAAGLITVLMIIQMESVVLGIISLVPNIPPVAAVFGIMGWFGIALDAVTVFAATVAIGLAVDNTIHFLAQLKREITLNPGARVQDCVRVAYRLTAKQIASWSVVTMFGFLALTVSPFRPVVFFGLLGCSSIVLGMFGDLIFMQSLILGSSAVRNTIRRLCEKEAAEANKVP